MAYFSDLSTYRYVHERKHGVVERNVGWLAASKSFPTAKADPGFLDRLWQFCCVSICQTRGLHDCEFCSEPASCFVERDGRRLHLGSAEIRVFATDGRVYAAPNLIYHYVAAHDYQPPAEFVEAVLRAPCPPEPRYFQMVAALGEDWNPTLAGDPDAKRFRFVKNPDGSIRREVIDD